MNPNLLKGAVENGAARIRHLVGGYTIISIPDAETAVLVMNPPNRPPIFDFSKCKRMSRGAAHRVVNSMDDAGQGLKALYHSLIDAKRQGGEE